MQISYENISVVIVLYNTKLEDSLTFKTLTQSIKSARISKLDLIIYDNSPKEQIIKKENHKEWEITYLHDVNNSGVSKAYNVASEISIKLGKTWILLTDQDTEFPKKSFFKYIENVNRFEKINLFLPYLRSGHVFYSPSKYFFSRGVIWRKPKIGIHSFKNKMALNSGILVNLRAFKLIGGYNEKVKLYFSDFDFINRFRKENKFFCLIDLVCKHQLSDVVNVDISAAKKRFYFYCEGGYYSCTSRVHFLALFSTIFLRSIKLSLRYKNFVFLKIFLKRYIY